MWGLRIRAFLEEYAVILIAAAVVLVLLGGWLTYGTHVSPGTESETHTEATWTTSGEYSHAATIQENTRVFSPGERVEQQPLYYTLLSPELDVAFEHHIDATSAEMDATATMSLVLQSVNEDDQELWRVEEQLTETTTTLSPESPVRLEATVNVTSVLAEFEAVEEELGAAPGERNTLLVTDIDADGTAEGGEAAHSERHEMTIRPGTDTYEVSADGETESYDRTSTTEAPIDYGPIRSALGPLLVAVGLVGSVGLAGARAKGSFVLTDKQRATVSFSERRREFDDWISQGRGKQLNGEPSDIVEVDSLSGLVDVAIDTDERVIEDIAAGGYYVLDGNIRYEYYPPADVDLRAFS